MGAKENLSREKRISAEPHPGLLIRVVAALGGLGLAVCITSMVLIVLHTPSSGFWGLRTVFVIVSMVSSIASVTYSFVLELERRAFIGASIAQALELRDLTVLSGSI
jgi:hypothetical protein